MYSSILAISNLPKLLICYLSKTTKIYTTVNQTVDWTTFTKTIIVDDAIGILGVGIYDAQLFDLNGLSCIAVRSFTFDSITKTLTVTLYGTFSANSKNSCQFIIYYR